MKKSVVLLTILLIASIAGTYAVYELYVKEKMKALGEHTEQVKQLEARIKVLQETFSGTQPQVIVDQWRQATQPWAEAVDGRSRFFTFGTLVEPVEIPEEVIPKIYYRNELPKRIQRLQDYALDKNVTLGDTSCGVPGATFYGEGTNPKREEIQRHFETYDYCAALSRMIIDAGPISIDPLRIWTEVEVKTRSGIVRKRGTGINMKTTTEPLIRFLDQLSQSDRYFKVDEIRISNANLRQQDPVLSVEMVLTQAAFEPAQKASVTGQGGTDGAGGGPSPALTTLFGGRRNAAAEEEDARNTPTRWQQFRRKWLPF